MGSKQMEASFSYNYVNVRKYTIYNPFFLKPLCGCLSPALLIVKMQMVIFYHAIKSAKKRSNDDGFQKITHYIAVMVFFDLCRSGYRGGEVCPNP